MPTINKQRIPAGGWRFPTNGGDFLRAHSFDDLLWWVNLYRRNCKLPVGNPEQEISDYLCEANPGDCGGEATVSVGNEALGLAQRVSDWAHSLALDKTIGNVPLVTQAEADRRAGTGCIGCPKNVPLGCCSNKQPSGELATLLARIRGGKDVTRYGPEMFGCGAFGFDTRTAVWLTRENLPVALPPNLPKRCWLPSAIVP